MGNTYTPMADSCEHMAKPPQYYKVISLQLKFKKKEHRSLKVLGFQKMVLCILIKD